MRLDMCSTSGQLVRIASSRPASATSAISPRAIVGDGAQRPALRVPAPGAAGAPARRDVIGRGLG